MHHAAGTAAESPETESDRADASREAARAVFREAATVAGTSLPGARGRRHRVQHTAVAIPQGFKNLQLANEAIEYVQNISKVATSRPSHMFSQVVRDDVGRLVLPHEPGEHSTFRPDAAQKLTMMRRFRDETDREMFNKVVDISSLGLTLTPYDAGVLSLRVGNAILLEKARNLGPDQLVANCLEKAMLAFDMLANKEDNPHLDIVELANTEEVTASAAITKEPVHLAQGPDHALLVIGRDPDSDIADPKTWGDDTVICDPWAKRTYAVSALKEEMELLSSTTNGQTLGSARISWPANTHYDSDPNVFYSELDEASVSSAGDSDDEQFPLRWIS